MEEEQVQDIEKTVLNWNQKALSFLAENQTAKAFEWLKKGQKLLMGEKKQDKQKVLVNQLLAIIYNNLSIYYKRTNKPKAALTFLKKALQIQTHELSDYLATATTHLNICAIYSYTKKHQDALDHAQFCISNAEQSKKTKQDDQKHEIACERIIAASQYNIAVETQNLKRYEEALEKYRNALEIAQSLNLSRLAQNCEQGINRTQKTIKDNKKHRLEIITKKKQNQEKGHCESMRKNIRHYGFNNQTKTVKTNKFALYENNEPVNHRNDIKGARTVAGTARRNKENDDTENKKTRKLEKKGNNKLPNINQRKNMIRSIC